MTEEQRVKHREYMRKYNQRPYAKLARNERVRRYRNSDRVRKMRVEESRRYRSKYQEKYLEYRRNYDRRNPEKKRERNRKSRPSKRAYYQRNRIKWYNYWLKRKALILGSVISDCSAKVTEIGRTLFCRWCCNSLTPENRTIDHVIPLSRGGSHTPDNLVAACEWCNKSRNNKLIHEWLPKPELIGA